MHGYMLWKACDMCPEYTCDARACTNVGRNVILVRRDSSTVARVYPMFALTRSTYLIVLSFSLHLCANIHVYAWMCLHTHLIIHFFLLYASCTYSFCKDVHTYIYLSIVDGIAFLNMSGMKGAAAQRMMKGVMDLRSDPPRLVCTVYTYLHPETRKEVTLLPLPNVASRNYLQRALNQDVIATRYDKILCEDGRLPLPAGSAAALRQQFWHRILPFVNMRPVVAADDQGRSKYEGITTRDPVESSMAYNMVMEGWEPPVDPRARRAVERIDGYDEATRVMVPWGVYHMPYLHYRLKQEGYTVTHKEELEAISFRSILYSFAISLCLFYMSMFLVYKTLTSSS